MTRVIRSSTTSSIGPAARSFQRVGSWVGSAWALASSTTGSTVTAKSTSTTARSPATGGSRTGKNKPLSIFTTVILLKGIAA
jgi:hypothetical protein